MKRKGNLFEKIVDRGNLTKAIENAARKKKSRRNVTKVLHNVPYHVDILHELLVSGNYRTSPYTIEIIRDGANGKEREIKKPKFFPDQCVQWAIMQIVEPILSKGFYQYSCGSVPNRGTHYAKNQVERWIRNDIPGTKYVLQVDITKYYPSVNHEKLNKMLATKIKDKKVLDLFDEIIQSGGAGIPIGNYTSQWLANFYLTECDNYIKQQLKAHHYVRYMDDMVIFGSNKRKLHKLRKELEVYLNNLDLRVKDNWQIFPLNKRFLDFLGFRFYRTHTTLRARNSLRIRRRVKKVHKKKEISFKDASALLSYMGWVKHSNSYTYYTKHVVPYVSIDKLKEVVRYESIQRDKA